MGEVVKADGNLETSIYALLPLHARERPEHPFIECIDTGRSLSFAAARDISGWIAAWYADRGIAANDRVAIAGGNSLEYLIFYLGILCHGATLCALPASIGENFSAVVQAVRPRITLYEEGLDLTKWFTEREIT